jgi:hypothetical protein
MEANMRRVKNRSVAAAVLLLLLPLHATSQQSQGLGRANQPPDPNAPRGTSRTIYSDKTELFITFRPQFIVGESVRIGAHLSKLGGERFLPYADAEVTATLTVAGISTKTTTPKPDRPGVFRLQLTPTKAGTGTLVVDITGRDGADRLVLEEMTVDADRASAVAHQGPDPDAGAIRYTKEHSWDENEYASAPVARVAMESGSTAQKVLAVPRTAIVEVDGVPYVYVQRHPEAFDLKPVKTGKRNSTYVEITGGIREGQRIVVKGGAKMPRK